MLPVSKTPIHDQFSKLAIVSLVILSSSACSRLQIGPSDPDVVESGGTYPSAPVVNQQNGSLYTVQQGDTLYLIGHRFGVSYQEIADWNNIASPYLIYPGQRLALSGQAAPVSHVPVARTEPEVLEFDWETGTVRPVGSTTPVPQAPQAPVVVADNTPVLEFDWETGMPREVSAPVTGSVGQGSMYTVKSGDTLSLVAQRHGVSYQDLATWNRLSPPYPLHVGQNLQVSAGASSSSFSVMNATPSQPLSALSNTSTATTSRYHRVQRGDTLYSVADLYRRDYREVAAWNNIPAPYYLRVGQNLQVSPAISGALSAAASANTPSPAQYQVKKGDTLSSIGRRFNRSVEELATWNSLRKPYPLNVGQSLRVAANMNLASASNTVPVVSVPVIPLSAMDMSGMSGMSGIVGAPKTHSIMTASAKPISAVPINLNTVPDTRSSTPPKTLRGEVVYHAVQNGESLDSIASHYQQKPEELALWNGIAPPYPIYPGQTIMIYR